MKTFEIYFNDLTEMAQKELESIVGTEHNYDVFPIATVDFETDDECPEGGDIENDCADCVYSAEYHFVDGECKKRKLNTVR